MRLNKDELKTVILGLNELLETEERIESEYFNEEKYDYSYLNYLNCLKEKMKFELERK